MYKWELGGAQRIIFNGNISFIYLTKSRRFSFVIFSVSLRFHPSGHLPPPTTSAHPLCYRKMNGTVWLADHYKIPV